MPWAEALAQAIDRAREDMRGDPRGVLDRVHRHLIWAALGVRDAQGRRRRARLAIISARRVLSIWERHWPKNREPFWEWWVREAVPEAGEQG